MQVPAPRNPVGDAGCRLSGARTKRLDRVRPPWKAFRVAGLPSPAQSALSLRENTGYCPWGVLPDRGRGLS